ncbi:hypothetical protein HK098_001856 [Nowakowskiella sp. JEL0407]|nr:hypothetical protein HK098_001856 [Nowakowskiella sp. JEL0407]
MFSWGVPFILATVLPFIGNEKDGPVYTDATLWCWIGGKYQSYRLYFFYIWLWAIFLWNLVIYIYVGSSLLSSQRKLANYGAKDGESSSEPWQPSASMRIYIRKTSFFILAFFLNWLWGSVNRIQNMIDPLHPIFALFLMHAIFTPLQGFLNFIAYFLVHFLFRSSNGKGSRTEGSRSDEATLSNISKPISKNGSTHKLNPETTISHNPYSGDVSYYPPNNAVKYQSSFQYSSNGLAPNSPNVPNYVPQFGYQANANVGHVEYPNQRYYDQSSGSNFVSNYNNYADNYSNTNPYGRR